MGAATLKVPTIFTAVDRMSGVFDNMGKKARSFNDKVSNIGKAAAIGGLAIVGALSIATASAVGFEDRMADVAKTTGLSGKPLDDYGKSLLDMSKHTRTSIEELQKIGEIGGQLGVASKDLISFTKASNQFAVALGADYGGGVEEAVSQVGKIKSLFKDTRSMNIADVITKSGSAINQLGAVGSGTSANINDFILRIGALPDAIKPSLTATAALGTFFEEAGIDSQIAAGGLSNFFLVAGKNLPAFAKQMGMGTAAAKQLFEKDPTAFAAKFATSIKSLSPDKLAVKLDDLKIGSQETIKVLGALGAGTERLTELQGVSADAFAKGTSLQQEYNTKNATTAAKLKIAKNNMEAFSITVGTQLLPILSKLIEKITPIIDLIGKWISDNPKLVDGVLLLAEGLGLVWVGAKLVNLWTWLASTAMGVMGAASGTASIAIGGNVVAMTAYKTTAALMTAGTWLMTAAQWAWNAAMTANPIGLIIVAIAALIYLVVEMIEHWNEWGSVVAIFMGPLGLVISMIESFRRNWEMVKKAFSEGGILEGLKAVGRVLLDAILQPVQSLLEMLAKIPGLGDLATAGANKIKEIRQSLDVNMAGDDKEVLDSPAQTTSDAAKNGKLDVNINDAGGNVKDTKYKGKLDVGVKTTSTYNNGSGGDW
ncbi:MAG: phage tail tape measure protein [Bacteroidota bacterium]